MRTNLLSILYAQTSLLMEKHLLAEYATLFERNY
jgi:hypothetical protein